MSDSYQEPRRKGSTVVIGTNVVVSASGLPTESQIGGQARPRTSLIEEGRYDPGSCSVLNDHILIDLSRPVDGLDPNIHMSIPRYKYRAIQEESVYVSSSARKWASEMMALPA